MTPSNGTLKLMRAARRVTLAVVALSALGAAGLFFNLDPMARRAVETQTTSALNLRTTVDSVTVHALSKQVDFADFRIASPAGFPTPDMLVVPSAQMDVAFSEFRGEPVHIASIILSHPRLVIEGDGKDFNLKRMVEGIPASAHPVHLIVDRVLVRDATVVLRNLPGIHGEVTIPVETFSVNNIGSDRPGGALIKEALLSLVTSLAVHAGDSPLMPAEYRAFIRGDLGQIVRATIPGGVGRLLSGLLGAQGDDPPGEKKARGLFGLGNFLGHSRAASTRPNE